MAYNDLRNHRRVRLRNAGANYPEKHHSELGNAVETVLELLDAGTLRVAEKVDGANGACNRMAEESRAAVLSHQRQ
jgi:hypothetical protein